MSKRVTKNSSSTPPFSTPDLSCLEAVLWVRMSLWIWDEHFSCSSSASPSHSLRCPSEEGNGDGVVYLGVVLVKVLK